MVAIILRRVGNDLLRTPALTFFEWQLPPAADAHVPLLAVPLLLVSEKPKMTERGIQCRYLQFSDSSLLDEARIDKWVIASPPTQAV